MRTTDVRFVSDSSVVAAGFNFSFSASACGGVFGGPSHVIQSPSVNVNSSNAEYPANVDCVWLMRFEEGQQVDVSIFLGYEQAIKMHGNRYFWSD